MKPHALNNEKLAQRVASTLDFSGNNASSLDNPNCLMFLETFRVHHNVSPMKTRNGSEERSEQLSFARTCLHKSLTVRYRLWLCSWVLALPCTSCLLHCEKPSDLSLICPGRAQTLGRISPCIFWAGQQIVCVFFFFSDISASLICPHRQSLGLFNPAQITSWPQWPLLNQNHPKHPKHSKTAKRNEPGCSEDGQPSSHPYFLEVIPETLQLADAKTGQVGQDCGHAVACCL